MSQWYNRFRERLRHGLVIQELLDRLAHAGVTIYPYWLMAEATATVGAGHETRAGVRIDEIHEADSEMLERVAAHRLSADKARLRFARGHRCFAIREDGRIAGYAWCRFDYCIGLVHNAPLFALAAGEATVYDTYIANAHRGKGLAVDLRRQLCRQLLHDGVGTVFSLGLYFDRSAQRVHEKLGAVRRETRVLLGLRRRWYRDLRLKRFGASLPIPRVHQPVRLP